MINTDTGLYICFIKPTKWDLIGRLICWRTGDDYHHSFVVADGFKYNPVIPFLKKQDVKGVDLGAAEIYYIPCTDIEKDLVQTFMNRQVGKIYDLLSLVGWAIGESSVQWRCDWYCHEFCHVVLEKLNLLPRFPKQIRAKLLISELKSLRFHNLLQP